MSGSFNGRSEEMGKKKRSIMINNGHIVGCPHSCIVNDNVETRIIFQECSCLLSDIFKTRKIQCNREKLAWSVLLFLQRSFRCSSAS